jgi:hypothetical protein
MIVHFKGNCFVKMIWIWLALPLALGLATPAIGQGKQASMIAKILTTPGLWGKDFPAALASLPAWKRAGDPSVAIFPDRIVGATPFKTTESAQSARTAMIQALNQRPPAAEPFVELLKGQTERILQAQSEILQFLDDDSYRVTVTWADAQFFPAGLTVKQVESLIGQPEAVTTQVIQSERDRRPVILTLHRYADGALIVAESDWAPKPGLVDRIILNVPTVSAVVFGGGQ